MRLQRPPLFQLSYASSLYFGTEGARVELARQLRSSALQAGAIAHWLDLPEVPSRRERESNAQGCEARPGSSRVPSPFGWSLQNAAGGNRTPNRRGKGPLLCLVELRLQARLQPCVCMSCRVPPRMVGESNSQASYGRPGSSRVGSPVPLTIQMRAEGIEPPTFGVRNRCLLPAELRAQFGEGHLVDQHEAGLRGGARHRPCPMQLSKNRTRESTGHHRVRRVLQVHGGWRNRTPCLDEERVYSPPRAPARLMSPLRSSLRVPRDPLKRRKAGTLSGPASLGSVELLARYITMGRALLADRCYPEGRCALRASRR